MRYIKHFIWFVKESQSFMCGKKDKLSYRVKIFLQSISKGIDHAKFMVEYEKMTSDQKLEWYTNENRVIEF